MGVNFTDFLIKKEISVSSLSNKKLVFDGNNLLYQFLSTIRQADGTPLMDSHGSITSHLNGLFHRTTKLMHYGMKLAFVFDGTPPKLKRRESERRANLKKEAAEMFEEASKVGDVEAMKKYSMRTSRLSREMIDEAVELIHALGLPVIQAPCEGEAQAAHLVKRGLVFAEVSQDYDCLLFGVPRMIQNLAISGRKKKKDRLSYEMVKPQLLELDENLKAKGITQDQLIVLGMLVGTDYNIGGIKGVGPKKAFDLLKQYGDDFERLFSDVKWDDYFDYSWREVFDVFKEMPVENGFDLRWTEFDSDRIVQILCGKHDFSSERVEETLAKLNKARSIISQKGLGDFL